MDHLVEHKTRGEGHLFETHRPVQLNNMPSPIITEIDYKLDLLLCGIL